MKTQGTGRGDFFAIDRRSWARACACDINAMVAYLVLARGSGADQRTTSWSVNAVENYTGIGRPRARHAIAALVHAKLLQVTQGGTRPHYNITPAHEVPGCEGYPPPELGSAEQAVFDYLLTGETWLPNETDSRWQYRNPRKVAADLVKMGRAKHLENCHFRAIPHDVDAAAKPDWIWLPNAIVDSASGEIAPAELARQTQKAAALRLLIDLYHDHDLSADGGINWRSIRRNYVRHTVGQRGPFLVYGFQPGVCSAWDHIHFVRVHMTGRLETPAGQDRARDCGWPNFWDAWRTLEELGLIEMVAHLIEADNNAASVIHPYAIVNGEAAERRLGAAAHDAGAAMLTEGQRQWAEERALHLAPVRKHIAEVQMVGLARLKYRPRTGATAAWWARMPEWQTMAERFEELASEARGGAKPAKMQHQG